MMERKINNDLKLIAVKANSFPEGVLLAYKELENKIHGGPAGRKFYGLSQGDGKRNIVYWACVLSNDSESVPAGCEQLIAKAGNYIGTQVSNWRGREEILGETFQVLISESDIDPKGYCVEEYLNNGDVFCMVRIRNGK